LLDRRALGVADALSILSVRVGDLVREGEDEAPVVLDLLRCCLSLEQLDRVAQMLQAVLFELLDRAVAGVVGLWLRRDDLVEKLALTMFSPRLHARPRH